MEIPFKNLAVQTYDFTPKDSKSFDHKNKLQALFCHVPGPLTCVAIMVPTIVKDNSGLPHSLEHLIFCGSEIYPHRGYLDALANRCFSTGTNAYTSEDHTCYSLVTSSVEGAFQVIPTFLDHVLCPTLSESSYKTEIFFDSVEGPKGVVFCEMAGRENSEADLLDRNLRLKVYGTNHPLAVEVGGLTDDIIIKLTLDSIKSYHNEFYKVQNLSIFICGAAAERPSITLDLIDDYLAKKSFIFNGNDNFNELPPLQISDIPVLVDFPSPDLELGSVGFAYAGPKPTDLKEIIALGIFFRYLKDSSASPLSQEFIEVPNPIVNCVDIEVKNYSQPAIFVVFSGVKNINAKGFSQEEEEEEEEDDDNDNDSVSAKSGSEGSSDESEDCDDDSGIDYLSENNLLEKFSTFLKQLIDLDFTHKALNMSGLGALKQACRRHKLKFLESIEDDPHDTIISYIIPELLVSRQTNFEMQPGVALANFVKIVDDLELENIEYWKQLAMKYLIDGKVSQVIMKPSNSLSEKVISERLNQHSLRMKSKDLNLVKMELERAISNNKIDRTLWNDKSFEQPLPKIGPSFPVNIVTSKPVDVFPFTEFQIVKTDYEFSSLLIALPIEGLPKVVLKYLVIFQELLFQSPIFIPTVCENFSLFPFNTVISYQNVVTKLTEELLSYDAGVGIGNDVFTTSYLSQFLIVTGTTHYSNFKNLSQLLIVVLIYSQWDTDRIDIVCNNLYSDLLESCRDPNEISSAAMTYLLDEDREITGDKNKRFHRNSWNQAIDHEISILRQRPFLLQLKKMCKSKIYDEIIYNLELIRSHILKEIISDHANGSLDGGFVQIGCSSKLLHESLMQEFGTYWKLFTCGKLIEKKVLLQSPWPQSTTLRNLSGRHLTVPLESATSSQVSITLSVPLQKMSSLEYWSILIVAQLLSQVEGPLYSLVRGEGLAYGAGITCSYWDQTITLSIWESVNPVCAIEKIITLFRYLEFESSNIDFSMLETEYSFPFDLPLFTKTSAESAMSSLAYQTHSSKSTAPNVISHALQNALKGLVDEESFDSALFSVEITHIKKAFLEHHKHLFDFNRTKSVIVASPSEINLIKNGLFTIGCLSEIASFDDLVEQANKIE